MLSLMQEVMLITIFLGTIVAVLSTCLNAGSLTKIRDVVETRFRTISEHLCEVDETVGEMEGRLPNDVKDWACRLTNLENERDDLQSRLTDATHYAKVLLVENAKKGTNEMKEVIERLGKFRRLAHELTESVESLEWELPHEESPD